MSLAIEGAPQEKASLLYDPKIRGWAWQIILLAVVVFLVYSATTNAIENLQKAKIASGFGFWNTISGFDIGQRLTLEALEVTFVDSTIEVEIRYRPAGEPDSRVVKFQRKGN